MKTLFKTFLSVFIIFSTNSFGQTKLTIGSEAPDFTLPDASGKEYTLSDYAGKTPVVVYFYPAAGTSGCTKQACAIRDDWNKFEENNIKVFGISTDTKEDVKKFVDDYNLNFPLLADEDKKITEQYGVLKENGTAKRVTFIIDKERKVADILEVKDIDSHSNYVFETALKLNSAEK